MDFSELVTEVQIRTGISDVASRAEYFVRNAERQLEKALKVGEMEVVATLTADEHGNAYLPPDLLQVRTNKTAEINGNVLRGKPNEDITLRYYTKFPSVIVAGTNWLLAQEPEIYVAAVMREVYVFAKMIPEAQAAGEYMAQLASAVNRADAVRRFANRAIDIGALHHEC